MYLKLPSHAIYDIYVVFKAKTVGEFPTVPQETMLNDIYVVVGSFKIFWEWFTIFYILNEFLRVYQIKLKIEFVSLIRFKN